MRLLIWLLMQLAVASCWDRPNIILDNDTVKYTMDTTYRVFGQSELAVFLPEFKKEGYGAIDQSGYRICRSQRATIPSDIEPDQRQILEIESAKDKLLSLMSGPKPLRVMREDANAFWTYSYTPVRMSQAYYTYEQVDGETQGKIHQSYTLGRAAARHGTESFHVEFDNKGTASLYEEWDNGTVCDLTLEPRKIKVSYVCDPSYDSKDMITSIAELQSCQYEATVAIAELCQFPSFRKHTLDVGRLECDEYLPSVLHQGRLSVVDLNKLDAVPLGEGVFLGTIADYPFHILLTTALRGSVDGIEYINKQLLRSVLLRIAKRTLANINRFPCPGWSDECSIDFVFVSDLYGVNGVRITTVYLEVVEGDTVSITTTDSGLDSNYVVYNGRSPFPMMKRIRRDERLEPKEKRGYTEEREDLNSNRELSLKR